MPFSFELKLVQLLLVSLEEVTGQSSDKVAVDVPLSSQIKLDGLQQVKFALQIDTHLGQVIEPGVFHIDMTINQIATVLQQATGEPKVAA